MRAETLVVALVLASASVPAAAEVPPHVLELRRGAWDTSVEREAAGDVSGARQVLLDAWGQHSDSYEVTVRIAWLSLLLEDEELAVAAYRRARALPGAGPEATEGFSSALTVRGLQRLEEGRRNEARLDFDEALRWSPQRDDARRGRQLAASMRLSAEFWGAYVGVLGDTPAHGGAGLVSASFHLNDWLRLRGAYRHLRQKVTIPVGTSQRRAESTTSFTQNDGYFAAAVVFPSWGLEGMGMILDVGEEGLVPGQAARLWVGRRWGLSVDEALIVRDVGASLQLTPMAFVWPTRNIGFGAGARFTVDDVGVAVAGRLGASVVTESIELQALGFVGRTRWAVMHDVPSVMTLAGEVEGGGTISAYVRLVDGFDLGVNGAVSVLPDEEQSFTYLSAGLGLRVRPPLETPP